MYDGSYLPFQQPQPQQEPQPTLVCDYCKNPIKLGEAAFHMLMGSVQMHRRNLSPMILPIDGKTVNEVDLHIDCLAPFLVEEAPYVIDEANECMDSRYGDKPEHEVEEIDVFCNACGVKFEPYDTSD